MAISYSIDTHAVCFPSKVLAGHGGEHIYNITLTADMDNGTIVGRGDWADFDEYTQAAAPTTFAGKIVDQAANGNYYVEVVTPAEAILIYEVPEIAENYNAKFSDYANFYNPSGATVRGYGLHVGDIFELSAAGFTTTPDSSSIGQAVSVSADTDTLGKLVIA